MPEAEIAEQSRRKRADRQARARERLAAAGVAVEDPDRPREGRQRKPAGLVLEGLRDGPNLPLRTVNFEDFARHTAGGLAVVAAWRAAGYSSTSGKTWEVLNHPDFIARVAELRAIFYAGPTLSVPYLQERLAALTVGDISDFVEKVPHTTSRYRVKDPDSLPPELRKAISEWTIDKDGRLSVKTHDKAKLFETLMRSLGAGGDGANVNVSQQVAFARIERVIVKAGSSPVQPADADGDRLRRLVEQFNRDHSDGEA
jgi:hypothetical protein